MIYHSIYTSIKSPFYYSINLTAYGSHDDDIMYHRALKLDRQ